MQQRRRIRHEIADAAVLMVFSAGVSLGIALLLALAVGLTAGAA